MGEPSLLTSWTLEPLQLAPIVLIAVAYAVRGRTLARRGQPVPGWRIALFSLGIALLVIASPRRLPRSARRSSSRST
jgi:cytochrome c oxidase assembly factor CtaG